MLLQTAVLSELSRRVIKMFNIILDGEVMETVHYTNLYEVRHYVKENYNYYGMRPTIKEVKD